MSLSNAFSIKGKSFTPHSYQRESIEWLLKHPYSGLFLSPGLGKTAIALASTKILMSQGMVEKTLVVAPLRVCHMVWPNEVQKWKEFNHLSVGILHGPRKDEVLEEEHDIYVVNPDGLNWLVKRMARNQFVKRNVKWQLIVDESSQFKNATSGRFKKLKSIARKFVRRTILTGTPAPNGLLNLWSQVYLVDMGERLGKYVTQYKNTFFYPSGFQGYYSTIQHDGEARIYKLLDDVIMHKGTDELDLPERVDNIVNIELPKDARQKYEDMKDEYVADLEENGEAIAINAAVTSGKLRQICNGGIYNSEGDAIHVHGAKTEAVKDLVGELNERPLMVFYEFKHDLARLKEAFRDAPNLGGGVSADESSDIIARWNANEIPVLFLHPQSAGHGLNLQESDCSDIMWYSIPWDLEHYEQAIARVHRQGVKHKVVVHHCVAENTIDQRIMKVLSGKAKLQDTLLEELKK